MATPLEGTLDERLHRRTTFDAVTDHYDRGRPGYPDQVFLDVIERSSIVPGSRLLEVGPGTGHATLPFARKGYQIDAWELGENLATRWRENLSDYPNARITVGQFEDATLEPASYDLIYAASAFHWIDPEVGYRKLQAALRPEGWVALWWNRNAAIPGNDDFARVAGGIYERLAPELVIADIDPPAIGDVPIPAGNRIAESGLFGPVEERRYAFTREYDAETLIALFDSYSRYQVLEPATRAQLFAEIRQAVDQELGGTVERGFTTLLYMAQPIGR